MKKQLAVLLAFSAVFFACSCGTGRSEKLYSEDEFLKALEVKYDADFEISGSNKVNSRETIYRVRLKDEPDMEFEVRNYLESSTEVGPAVNRIKSNELMYYLISPDAYEGYMLYKDGELDSGYYVLPKLGGSDSYDGRYTAVVSSEDKKVMITVMSGSDEIAVFSPGDESEWRGVCWDKNSYDLWMQYQGGVLVCYSMTDNGWEEDPGAEKPDYIVYNISPTVK